MLGSGNFWIGVVAGVAGVYAWNAYSARKAS